MYLLQLIVSLKQNIATALYFVISFGTILANQNGVNR